MTEFRLGEPWVVTEERTDPFTVHILSYVPGTTTVSFPDAFVAQLGELPEWADAERLLSSAIAAAGVVLPNYEGGKHRELLAASKLLPPPDPEWIDRHAAEHFEAAYESLERVLYDRRRHVTVFVLRFVPSPDEPVHLSEDLEFDRLTPDETAQALNCGAIRLAGDETQVVVSQYQNQFGCLRFLHEDFNDPDVAAVRDQIGQWLALATPYTHLSLGYFQVARDPQFVGYGRTSQGAPGHHHRPETFAMVPADRLADLWRLVMNPNLPPELKLALRRLAFAAQRTAGEDKLLDFMIAAEALYLRGIKGELSYRLALRAGLWAQGNSARKLEVQRFMSTAYGVRSTIAHGEEVKPKRLKIRNESVSLDEFAAELRDVLAEGVERALRAAVDRLAVDGSSWPPDWDALIFG